MDPLSTQKIVKFSLSCTHARCTVPNNAYHPNLFSTQKNPCAPPPSSNYQTPPVHLKFSTKFYGAQAFSRFTPSEFNELPPHCPNTTRPYIPIQTQDPSRWCVFFRFYSLLTIIIVFPVFYMFCPTIACPITQKSCHLACDCMNHVEVGSVSQV